MNPTILPKGKLTAQTHMLLADVHPLQTAVAWNLFSIVGYRMCFCQ